MELSELQSPPVPAVYEKDGKVLINMMVDADLLTPDFLSGVSEMTKIGEGTISESVSQVGFFARVLSESIKAWDLTDKGVAVAITESFFRGRPVRLLADLFEVVLAAGTDDKKKLVQTSDAIT